MTRFLIVPMRFPDDEAIGRYAVQAAHADRGLVVLLDLGESLADGAIGRPFVDEMLRTVRGNRQELGVIASSASLAELATGEDGDAGPSPRLEGDLEECLTIFAPPGEVSNVRLTLPARLEYLAPVRRYLAAIVRERYGEADAFPVEILVDELCLNAVENSPSDRNSYDVEFDCASGDLRLDVTNVFDDSIDSERIMHRRLQSFDDSGDYLGERGRGLFLIARIADGLQILSLDPDRIRVTVTRRLGRGNGGTDGAG